MACDGFAARQRSGPRRTDCLSLAASGPACVGRAWSRRRVHTPVIRLEVLASARDPRCFSHPAEEPSSGVLLVFDGALARFHFANVRRPAHPFAPGRTFALGSLDCGLASPEAAVSSGMQCSRGSRLWLGSSSPPTWRMRHSSQCFPHAPWRSRSTITPGRGSNRTLRRYSGWREHRFLLASSPLVVQRQRQQSGIWLALSRCAQGVLDRCRFSELLEWRRASVPGRARVRRAKMP